MTDKWTDKGMDICECRVAFANENYFYEALELFFLSKCQERLWQAIATNPGRPKQNVRKLEVSNVI